MCRRFSKHVWNFRKRSEYFRKRDTRFSYYFGRNRNIFTAGSIFWQNWMKTLPRVVFFDKSERKRTKMFKTDTVQKHRDLTNINIFVAPVACFC